MNKKLTSKHLDLLAKLEISEEPIKLSNLEEIKLASDLINLGLAEQKGEKEEKYIVSYYEINNNGRNYFNKTLQDASKHRD